MLALSYTRHETLSKSYLMSLRLIGKMGINDLFLRIILRLNQTLYIMHQTQSLACHNYSIILAAAAVYLFPEFGQEGGFYLTQLTFYSTSKN